MRAYGWWHRGADRLIARQLQWGRRAGTLALSAPETARSADGAVSAASDVSAAIATQEQLDMLVANMMLLGALTDRLVVVPDFPCGFAAPGGSRGYGHRPIGAHH